MYGVFEETHTDQYVRAATTFGAETTVSYTHLDVYKRQGSLKPNPR